jgi:RNA polymerase sigma-70 factor (ECF subfamily)
MGNSMVRTGLIEPSTSFSLLARVQAGNSLAWHELVQLYGPVVYAWLRRSQFQPADASDIMQDTLIAVVKQLPKFNCSQPGATFRGWLWTITRNKSVDHLRKQSGQPNAVGGSSMQAMIQGVTESTIDQDPPSEIAMDRAAVCRRALANLRDQFEPQSWLAFWRTTVDGCSPEDVADELKISRWAVYKARSRVLHRLRLHLLGLEELP